MFIAQSSKQSALVSLTSLNEVFHRRCLMQIVCNGGVLCQTILAHKISGNRVPFPRKLKGLPVMVLLVSTRRMLKGTVLVMGLEQGQCA